MLIKLLTSIGIVTFGFGTASSTFTTEVPYIENTEFLIKQLPQEVTSLESSYDFDREIYNNIY